MKKLLFHLDTDARPSAFDQVVAYDGGADAVLAYGGVTADNCFPLVEGAIFTRAPKNKRYTAILIGGSDLAQAQALMDTVKSQFFEGFRVSLMMDANGCNTTAAAAVAMLGAAHPLEGSSATVLAGTGPVGQRAAVMLAQSGARVRLTSRKLERARQACEGISERYGVAVEPMAASDAAGTAAAIEGAAIVLATGQAGVQLLPTEIWQASSGLRAVGDVGTCPPLGVEGMDMTDGGREVGGVSLFGGLAFGALKLRTHREAISRMFESNDQVWDAEETLALARELHD